MPPSIALSITRRGFGRAQSGPSPGQVYPGTGVQAPSPGDASTGEVVGTCLDAGGRRAAWDCAGAVATGPAGGVATVVLAASPAATHWLTPTAPAVTAMTIAVLTPAPTTRETGTSLSASPPRRRARRGRSRRARSSLACRGRGRWAGGRPG